MDDTGALSGDPFPIIDSGVESALTSDNQTCRDSQIKIIGTRDLEEPAAVRERIRRGVAANTTRAYTGVWGRFEAWCKIEDRTPLPATRQSLNAYVEHLCEEGHSPATIEHAIAVIRTKHKLADYDDQPVTIDARSMLRGYKRDWSDAGNSVRKAPAAVVDTVKAMVATCDATTLRGLRDRSIIVLGFALMGRRSEMSNLNIPDLTLADEGLRVRIRYSKTDQEAKGTTVLVPYGEHPETCPVLCTLAWLAALERRKITSGPLYLAIDKWGNVGDERAGRRSSRFTPHSINTVVKAAAAKVGKAGITAHSLRAGGATSAAKNGAPTGAVKEHGRWKSDQVYEYCRAADEWDDNPMKGIGL